MRKSHAVCLISLALSSGCVAVAHAGPAQPTAKVATIDQSLEMQTVGLPKISPDGTRVVNEVWRTNGEGNSFDTGHPVMWRLGVPPLRFAPVEMTIFLRCGQENPSCRTESLWVADAGSSPTNHPDWEVHRQS